MSHWKIVKMLALAAAVLLAPAHAALAGGGGGGDPGAQFRGDLDGDGVTDVVFRKASSGSVNIFLLNTDGSVDQQGGFASPGSDWVIRGLGRNDSGDTDDIFWQNTTTAAIKVWYMNGTSRSGTAIVGTQTNTNWGVVGVGDLDNDQRADLVHVRSDNNNVAVWVLDGADISESSTYSGDSDLDFAGIGEFSGDENGDIVWQGDGSVFAWPMDGATRDGTLTLGTSFNPNWSLDTVLDVNGDNRGDLFFTRDGTNSAAIWDMDGDTISSSAGFAVGSAWDVGGSGQVDGSAGEDVIWGRNSGRTVIWNFNGTTRTSTNEVDVNAGSNNPIVNQGE